MKPKNETYVSTVDAHIRCVDAEEVRHQWKRMRDASHDPDVAENEFDDPGSIKI